MLRLLRIRNFAIIDELELEFHSGFNAITGETGTGKSIILDAISLILGNRANTEVIRTGFEEASVEAIFDLGPNEAVAQKLSAYGFSPEKTDHEVLIKRIVQRNGKNKIFLYGELVTLSQLAEVTETLVELCSQHENQSLSKSAFQLDIIDRYGGLATLKRDLRELFSALRSAESELSGILGADPHQARTQDFLKFQLQEIDQFAPQQGEEESLLADRKRLLNVTGLLENTNQCLAFLGETSMGEISGENTENIRVLIAKVLQRFNKIIQVDDSLKKAAESMTRANVEIEETISILTSYASALELDPARIEEIEDRLGRLSEIKKKYGKSYEEIMNTRAQLEAELTEFEDKQARIAKLESSIATLKDEYAKKAAEISKKRKNISKTLKNTVQKELSELMMPSVCFEIEFTELSQDQWGPDGFDRISFLFSANKGEDLKPLGKIASGGELSRIMLALRRTIADQGGIGVYLFDEIDAGIGGQTASIVGKKLQSVSKHNQVICITHLPQVAAYAETHFSVMKVTQKGRTTSQIQTLSNSARVEELARMLGGLNITEKSKAHAKDLLSEGSQKTARLASSSPKSQTPPGNR